MAWHHRKNYNIVSKLQRDSIVRTFLCLHWWQISLSRLSSWLWVLFWLLRNYL